MYQQDRAISDLQPTVANIKQTALGIRGEVDSQNECGGVILQAIGVLVTLAILRSAKAGQILFLSRICREIQSFH